jgi:hypothetical protein
MPKRLNGLDQRDPNLKKITEWAEELYKEQEPYIKPTKGGTGLTSYAAGDILYASDAQTLAKLAKGSNGQYLTLSGGVPAWGTVSIPAATEPGWELIGDYTVSGGAVSSITFSSLDGNTDEWYRFEIWVKNASANSAVCLRPNNDATANNYRYQYGLDANTTPSAARGDFTNGMILLNTTTVGDLGMARGTLYAKTGNRRICISDNMSHVNGTSQDCYEWRNQWKDTSTNITSLVFFGSAAGAMFDNGSRVRLWKAVAL